VPSKIFSFASFGGAFYPSAAPLVRPAEILEIR
jgi:hypothetical protein